ncbi:SDR family oxidoreductase [Massilia agri]|uniref:SDR family oxidoreductase n=1 Tax=Massilia agri TaxID=1886785 RepID=A0ABT2AMU7_9BURK|nr:SDR family oxidoreductase [Massilia agri]MCS0597578.1 SDR family oxidoreductase [Massilia agri]
MHTHTGRTAIVTGGSRGIGREIALRLAAQGCDVVVNYHGREDLAEAVVRAVEARGRRAIAVRGDVADEAEAEALFRAALDAFGRIDVVVSNAGIMKNVPIADGALADFDAIMRTNARGAFIVLSKAGNHLGEGGRIIALSSSVIARSTPGYGPYIASKAAVEGLVRVMANELRGRGICVNAVAPGPVGTELFLEGKSAEQIAALARMAPLERLGTPADIASIVAFLAGPEGAWVNAQVVRVNGGFA